MCSCFQGNKKDVWVIMVMMVVVVRKFILVNNLMKTQLTPFLAGIGFFFPIMEGFTSATRTTTCHAQPICKLKQRLMQQIYVSCRAPVKQAVKEQPGHSAASRLALKKKKSSDRAAETQQARSTATCS